MNTVHFINEEETMQPRQKYIADTEEPQQLGFIFVGKVINTLQKKNSHGNSSPSTKH